ncbi:MAG: hypothetical protein M1371_06460, partial [Actinobacteria bacterium]|nr:hypothetical protein [Actinomycetota bacterium]
EWGIRLRKIPYKTLFGIGYYNEIIEHPLADDDAINSYAPPDPNLVDFNPSIELMKKYGKSHYIIGDITVLAFEPLRYLRGWEQGLMDLMLNPDLASRIMDMVVNYNLFFAKRLIGLGVDAIWFGDDVGLEHDLMISPEIYRKLIKPRVAYVVNELRKVNPNIKIAYHSDGCIYKILDDLVEAGVNIIHGVQPESMDPVWIKKRYAKKLVLWGAIGVQTILPFGSAVDVKSEVHRTIKDLAPGGGYILATASRIQLDVPSENIAAFYQATRKYGKYPIKA